jgi:putative NIF3 family GTP cyclohydrolase 1 type 2
MKSPALALALALALGVPAPSIAQKPTARQVVERIRQNLGVPWAEPTIDTFKDGNPDTPVTGIAVTMMATQDVLQRAAAAGDNFIITHEPTFYSHADALDALEKAGDPVVAAKRAFIREHGLVVWRFHDNWHRRRPEGIQTGMVKKLGWEKYAHADDPWTFTLPPTTVGALARVLSRRLDASALRIVGDPALRVTHVALTGGFPGFEAQRSLLARDDVELLVMGEAHEWETIPYATDAVTQGRHKAMIVLGHVPSEQAGMEEATRWIRGFVTEVPVQFIATKEPFRALK